MLMILTITTSPEQSRSQGKSLVKSKLIRKARIVIQAIITTKLGTQARVIKKTGIHANQKTEITNQAMIEAEVVAIGTE